jgi:hypothetical protein
LWAQTDGGSAEKLLEEMRSQICLVSVLDGPPYPTAEEKIILYEKVQHCARLTREAFGEFATRIRSLLSLIGSKDMWSWPMTRSTTQ